MLSKIGPIALFAASMSDVAEAAVREDRELIR